MVGHHRENAVVLVYRGLYEFLMGNVESGVFPFNSVLFGGCLPIVSPDVSPSTNNEIEQLFTIKLYNYDKNSNNIQP